MQHNNFEQRLTGSNPEKRGRIQTALGALLGGNTARVRRIRWHSGHVVTKVMAEARSQITVKAVRLVAVPPGVVT